MNWQRLTLIFLTLLTVDSVIVQPILAKDTPQQKIIQVSEKTSPQITEAAIQEMIDKIKLDFQNKNYSSIFNYFAPFVYSEITIKTENISETITLDGLKANRNYLESQWQKVKDSETLDETLRIDISEDGEMAWIKRNRTIDVTTTEGKKMIISSESQARVTKVEGALKIISIQETANVSKRPD